MRESFDMLVVGGGINGAGIARDAAERGLSVCLCEQDDLAAHTSSASTKLIHGGLRYLQQGEVALVRKALNERETLRQLAPHLIAPTTFVLPHARHLRPAWMLRAGLWLYDHLGQRSLQWRAGSGAIDERDGSGHMAAFAQPCSVAAVQQVLYVCDALGSSIRAMQLRGDLVQTLVGQGLWSFGDQDGPRASALLQYPQAIALSPDAPLLWIADAGNGRLRTLRLGGGELSTLELPRRLHGPAGLALGGGAVWIAETDAHAVLRFDPVSGVLSDVPINE